MNCCNHNCTQGRDCPARVAKIGRKDYAKEPYPASPWQRYLKHLARWMLVCIAALLMLAAFVMSLMVKGERRIDCTWAEISPDFTPAMREACRKARRA